MINIGDLFEVNGQRMIFREENKDDLMFWARSFNQHYDRIEFQTMIESGDATLIKKAPVK